MHLLQHLVVTLDKAWLAILDTCRPFFKHTSLIHFPGVGVDSSVLTTWTLLMGSGCAGGWVQSPTELMFGLAEGPWLGGLFLRKLPCD